MNKNSILKFITNLFILLVIWGLNLRTSLSEFQVVETNLYKNGSNQEYTHTPGTFQFCTPNKKTKGSSNEISSMQTKYTKNNGTLNINFNLFGYGSNTTFDEEIDTFADCIETNNYCWAQSKTFSSNSSVFTFNHSTENTSYAFFPIFVVSTDDDQFSYGGMPYMKTVEYNEEEMSSTVTMNFAGVNQSSISDCVFMYTPINDENTVQVEAVTFTWPEWAAEGDPTGVCVYHEFSQQFDFTPNVMVSAAVNTTSSENIAYWADSVTTDGVQMCVAILNSSANASEFSNVDGVFYYAAMTKGCSYNYQNITIPFPADFAEKFPNFQGTASKIMDTFKNKEVLVYDGVQFDFSNSEVVIANNTISIILATKYNDQESWKSKIDNVFKASSIQSAIETINSNFGSEFINVAANVCKDIGTFDALCQKVMEFTENNGYNFTCEANQFKQGSSCYCIPPMVADENGTCSINCTNSTNATTCCSGSESIFENDTCKCIIGKYVSNTSDSCFECGAGYDDMYCCPPDYHYDISKASCVCSFHYFNGTCVPECPPYSYVEETINECVCEFGYYPYNGTCINLTSLGCPNTSYPTQSGCVSCPANSVFNEITGYCQCEAGFGFDKFPLNTSQTPQCVQCISSCPDVGFCCSDPFQIYQNDSCKCMEGTKYSTQDPLTATCVVCGVGYDDLYCCAPNEIYNVTTETCTCPFYYLEATLCVETCPEFSIKVYEESMCFCEPGYYHDNGNCLPLSNLNCSSTTYPSSYSGCLDCPENSSFNSYTDYCSCDQAGFGISIDENGTAVCVECEIVESQVGACKCPTGSKYTINSNIPSPCASCQFSYDDFYCCAPNEIYYDGNCYCYEFSIGDTCVSACPENSQVTMAYECICNDGYTPINGTCAPNQTTTSPSKVEMSQNVKTALRLLQDGCVSVFEEMTWSIINSVNCSVQAVEECVNGSANIYYVSGNQSTIVYTFDSGNCTIVNSTEESSCNTEANFTVPCTDENVTNETKASVSHLIASESGYNVTIVEAGSDDPGSTTVIIVIVVVIIIVIIVAVVAYVFMKKKK